MNDKNTHLFKTKECYELWESEKFVLIVAGTGAGKTYFIIYEFAKSFSDKKILYFTNRTALRNSIEEEITKAGSSNIIVKNYQYLEVNDINLDQYDFVICDECHYFVSDSVFNQNTFYSFDKIMKANSTKIFLTATPQAIFSVLVDKYHLKISSDSDTELIKIIENGSSKMIMTNPEASQEMLTGRKHLEASKLLQERYNISKILFYCNISTLNEKIKKLYIYQNDSYLRETVFQKIKPGDKTIIFMSRFRKSSNGFNGLLDWKEYLEERGKTVSLICADSTSNPEAKKLKKEIENNKEELKSQKKFNADFLITTTALDNGIDILDDQVKYIICDLIEENTIVLEQCLGRKRLNADEQVTVFIREKDDKILKGKRTEAKKILETYDQLEALDNCKLANLDGDLVLKCCYFEINNDILGLRPDPLKKAYWKYELSCLKGDYSFLLSRKLRLFYRRIYDVEKERKKAKIEDLLKKYEGKILSGEKKNEIIREISILSENGDKKTNIKTLNNYLWCHGVGHSLVEHRTTDSRNVKIAAWSEEEWDQYWQNYDWLIY